MSGINYSRRIEIEAQTRAWMHIARRGAHTHPPIVCAAAQETQPQPACTTETLHHRPRPCTESTRTAASRRKPHEQKNTPLF